MAIVIAIETVSRVADLGAEWDTLFHTAPGVQSSRLWFEATEEAALPDGASPHYVMAAEAGRPVALLPMQAGRGLHRSLTTPYTTQFQPLLTGDADARAVGLAIGRHLRRWPVVLLEALNPAWSGLKPFLGGLRQAGMIPNRFDHFGNWHECVAGLDWAAYLAGRPGALRETIRRRGRDAARDGTVTFEVLDGCTGLDGAMAAYEAIYAKSWKMPEPYPRFNAALLPRLAQAGVLRLAVMRRAGLAVAAQYWTVQDGVATVLKLAHDDDARAISPGTLLTAHVIRMLLEQEWIQELDFGRGDDPYKQSWAGGRRQRIGVMLANPRRPGGLVALARHELGRALRGKRERPPSRGEDPDP